MPPKRTLERMIDGVVRAGLVATRARDVIDSATLVGVTLLREMTYLRQKRRRDERGSHSSQVVPVATSVATSSGSA